MSKFRVLYAVVLGLLAMALFVFAGCGGAKDTSSNDYVIEMGFFDCDHMVAAPLAQAMKIHEANGVKVNVTMGSQVPQAMSAGQMDVGYIGTNGAMFAVQNGSPIVAVAENHRGGSLYIVASHDITSPEQLIGKRIAPVAEDAHHRSIIYSDMMRKLGLDPDPANYENFSMTQRDAYLAFKIGELDAIVVCDPWGSMAEYENTGHILVTNDRLPDGSWGSCCLLFMRRGFIEDHPELAKRVLQAHIDAIKFIYLNPVQAAKVFSETFHVPEEVGLMTIFKKTVYEDRTLSWTLNPQAIENWFENAKQNGMRDIQNYEPVENWVTNELLEAIDAEEFDDFIKREVDHIFPYGMSWEDWLEKAFQIHESTEY